MKVTPATLETTLYVLDNLWPRGEEELRLLSLSKEDALYRFLHYAKLGRNQTLWGDDGLPVVIVGIATEDGESFTWFQATSHFDRYAMQITRHIRREAAAHAGPLHIYSVCVHPDTERWFRVMGFLPDGFEQSLPSGATLRRFTRG